MNTPTTFNELMTVISGHVSTYLNERVVGVVSLLCEKYDLSYDEVILSIPETTNLTCPIVSKKYKKKIKFVVSDSNEESIVPVPETNPIPEAPLIKPKKRPAKKVPEPETLVVEEEQGTAVPEAPLIKPKKRPAKKTPEQVPASGTTNDKRPAKKPRDSPKQKDIQIDDLPSDEASWFNEILGKSGHPEIAKSFFPSRPMLLPDCDVYSDDGIVDDYEDESIKYVTDE